MQILTGNILSNIQAVTSQAVTTPAPILPSLACNPPPAPSSQTHPLPFPSLSTRTQAAPLMDKY